MAIKDSIKNTRFLYGSAAIGTGAGAGIQLYRDLRATRAGKKELTTKQVVSNAVDGAIVGFGAGAVVGLAGNIKTKDDKVVIDHVKDALGKIHPRLGGSSEASPSSETVQSEPAQVEGGSEQKTFRQRLGERFGRVGPETPGAVSQQPTGGAPGGVDDKFEYQLDSLSGRAWAGENSAASRQFERLTSGLGAAGAKLEYNLDAVRAMTELRAGNSKPWNALVERAQQATTVTETYDALLSKLGPYAQDVDKRALTAAIAEKLQGKPEALDNLLRGVNRKAVEREMQRAVDFLKADPSSEDRKRSIVLSVLLKLRKSGLKPKPGDGDYLLRQLDLVETRVGGHENRLALNVKNMAERILGEDGGGVSGAIGAVTKAAVDTAPAKSDPQEWGRFRRWFWGSGPVAVIKGDFSK